jgi:O-antigen ligase
MRHQGISPRTLSECEVTESLLAFRPTKLWKAFLDEGYAFKAACAYMFFEYFRPQQIYESLAVVPWSAIALLTGVLSLLLRRRGVWLGGRPGALLGVFTLVVFLSSVMAVDPAQSWGVWKQYFLWVPVFLLIVNTVDTPSRMVIFLAGWLLWNAKMSFSGVKQWAFGGFAYQDWGVAGAPGWFGNSGELAIEMSIFVAISVQLILAMWKSWPIWKRYLMLSLPATALVTIVAAASRGGLLGAAAVLMTIVATTKYRVRGLFYGGTVVVLLFLITPQEFLDRFETAGTDNTSVTRLTYLRRGLEITRDHPYLGIGFGNWLPYYEARYGERGHEPHNIFIQAMSELGYTGFLVFIALILCTFSLNWRTRKLLRTHLSHAPPAFGRLANGMDAALVGYMVAGFFVTVLYYPFFWVNFALSVALHRVTRQEALARGPAARIANRPVRGLYRRWRPVPTITVPDQAL